MPCSGGIVVVVVVGGAVVVVASEVEAGAAVVEVVAGVEDGGTVVTGVVVVTASWGPPVQATAASARAATRAKLRMGRQGIGAVRLFGHNERMVRYSFRKPASPPSTAANLNYDGAGLCERDAGPPGFRRRRLKARIGTGGQWYRRAREALLDLAMYDLPWMAVAGPARPLEAGQRLQTASRLLGVWIAGPVEVLDLVDGPNRCALTIGTLDGHPLRGEERFAVELDPATAAVVFQIDAVSRPQGLARIAAPLTRFLQARFRRHAADVMAARSRPPR